MPLQGTQANRHDAELTAVRYMSVTSSPVSVANERVASKNQDAQRGLC